MTKKKKIIYLISAAIIFITTLIIPFLMNNNFLEPGFLAFFIISKIIFVIILIWATIYLYKKELMKISFYLTIVITILLQFTPALLRIVFNGTSNQYIWALVILCASIFIYFTYIRGVLYIEENNNANKLSSE